eukprot:CAMPEP_0172494326 /NCGR_PEP_ID=MMETSP1066-20121228/45227_1 /TAXON_ID=671091 /ORGANISM="Coscinodiscus wailesii, Strain CCMP2513" /LENGTH=177 /DNA_ID=CAMNT_0013265217 /DNA_START=208 /DNA_END=741 /DNA_ORIENTATION=-
MAAEETGTATPTPNTLFDSLEDEIDDANKRYTNIVKVVETPDCGWGVRASRTFSKHEKVMTAKALAVTARDAHTLQKDWDKHVLVDLPSRFINHSCEANVGIKDNSLGAYDFFALEEIKEGEDMFWDYETAEYEPLGGFQNCKCGALKCRGLMKGFKDSGNTIKKQYGSYYANYLKK